MINGYQIRYEIEGSGRDILLLHGWGACIESFAPVINALKTRRRVIAVDFPGHGQSPLPGKDMTVSDYTELTAALMRSLGLGKTDIICHSFGGRVTILLAAKYPELAGKIAFVDAAGVKPKRGMKYYAKVYSYKLCKKIARTKGLKTAAMFFGVDVDRRVQNAGSTDYKNLPEVMKKTFINVVNEDLTPYLKKIKSPSLLVWGENDTDTPLYMAQIMEKEIPDAGLVVFKDAGHFSYLDQFGQFMAVINSFFKE
ncbi:MAG: alpha/beta hydrolase [Christensenella sp.]|nr:alpha/beta hydrolase [Christensenella sp.]